MPLNLVWKVLDDFVGYNNELAKTTLGKFRKFNSIMASWAIELVNLANPKYEFHIIIDGGTNVLQWVDILELLSMKTT